MLKWTQWALWIAAGVTVLLFTLSRLLPNVGEEKPVPESPVVSQVPPGVPGTAKKISDIGGGIWLLNEGFTEPAVNWQIASEYLYPFTNTIAIRLLGEPTGEDQRSGVGGKYVPEFNLTWLGFPVDKKEKDLAYAAVYVRRIRMGEPVDIALMWDEVYRLHPEYDDATGSTAVVVLATATSVPTATPQPSPSAVVVIMPTSTPLPLPPTPMPTLQTIPVSPSSVSVPVGSTLPSNPSGSGIELIGSGQCEVTEDHKRQMRQYMIDGMDIARELFGNEPWFRQYEPNLANGKTVLTSVPVIIRYLTWEQLKSVCLSYTVCTDVRDRSMWKFNPLNAQNPGYIEIFMNSEPWAPILAESTFEYEIEHFRGRHECDITEEAFAHELAHNIARAYGDPEDGAEPSVIPGRSRTEYITKYAMDNYQFVTQ
jgi:hypothetical protein